MRANGDAQTAQRAQLHRAPHLQPACTFPPVSCPCPCPCPIPPSTRPPSKQPAHSLTRLEQVRHNLLHTGRLCAIKVRGAAARDLLGPQLHVEHGWLVGGPGEEDVGAGALRNCNAVLEGSFVEGIGGELAAGDGEGRAVGLERGWQCLMNGAGVRDGCGGKALGKRSRQAGRQASSKQRATTTPLAMSTHPATQPAAHLRAGCMRYCTASRMGFTPSSISRSNSDWLSPARAAALFTMTGPSWQWSPTSTSCRRAGWAAGEQAEIVSSQY